MQPTTRPTLAETIASGARLLAAAGGAPDGGGARATPPVADVPRQAARGAGPEAETDGGWRSPDDIARVLRCDPWTVAEHLRNGTLHGHVESGAWQVRDRVADAFLEGLDLAAQRRTCGCGARLRLVHGSGPRTGDDLLESTVPRPGRRIAAVPAPSRPAMSEVAPTLEA